jgi:D-alanyl-D-alanine endopeptidase (penicillin-binding protein 7)
VGALGRIATFGVALVATCALNAPTTVFAAAPTQRATAEVGKSVARPSKKVRAKRRAAPRPSEGQLAGLSHDDDELALRSRVALVVDQDTDEVLLDKNSGAVLPIASITKLMTALVVVEAQLPLDETLEITRADLDSRSTARSRLRVGTQLTREQMMHLALMSSENRAAHALGRHYPGGVDAFVEAMNRKASALGMSDTHFVEPTGLSSDNRSSARDLATLAKAAYEFPLIRQLSTSDEQAVGVGRRTVQYRNTNRLVYNDSWEIGLQKTGYIAAAGRCLVMQASLAGRHLIMVFLDSAGKYSRLGDAERVRRWIQETLPAVPVQKALESLSAASPPMTDGE